MSIKTKPTKKSVTKFLNSIANETKRKDAKTILQIIKKVTGKKPVMWGDSIVGFDTYHYKYASGREGDWPMTGFSPRQQNLTVYIMPGFGNYQNLLKKLGKHKTAVSCLYIKKLADVDLKILEEIIRRGYEDMKKKYAK